MGHRIELVGAVVVSVATIWIAKGEANLACGKPYRLTRAPNYALSKDAGDDVQLTDGSRAGEVGYLWTDKAAVTWQECKCPVGIVVDLGETSCVSGFSMDFAAGASGVPYPDSIMVYSSVDGKKWAFLGDLYEKSRQENGAPRMDGYERYLAKSTRMPTVGRFIQFMVTAGAFFSTSEIEVFRGNSGALPVETVTDPLAHVLTRRIVDRILRDLNRVAPADRELRHQVESLAEEKNPAAISTLLPLNDVHRKVWAKNAANLRAAGFARPLLWVNDRWENLDPLVVPDDIPEDAVALSVEMMRGETRSTAVNILNPTDSDLSCVFSVEGLPSGSGVDCREVLFTDTKLLEPVSGALRPGRGCQVTFCIPAGTTRQVWISFAKPQVSAGDYMGRILAKLENGVVLEGTVRLRVHDLDFPARPSVHVCGWDYSIGDCSAFKAPGNAKANQAMMREIYTDVFWAPKEVLPRNAKFGQNGELQNPDAVDFRLWDEWTARFPDARRYAVFMSVDRMKTGNSFSFCGESVGTERFGRMASAYFRLWRSHMLDRSVDPRKLLLLLVDEPAEWQPRYKELPALIVAWAKVIKAAVPEFSIWEDPDYTGDPRQAGMEMYDWCDVLCLQTAKVSHLGEGPSLSRSFFAPLAESGKEMWIYSCSGPSRTHDPISYYRQAFWLAYQWKAVGCGFWAFGCGGGIGDSWHAYGQPGVEYSPYFVSPTDVMAAKQSEGIKEGVQDFEYLKMLERAVSKAKARGLDVGGAERLLLTAPVLALNQTGKDGRTRLVRADSRDWNAPKNRRAVEDARLSVLRALADVTVAIKNVGK